MTKQTKTDPLNDTDLDGVQGGGLLLPAVQAAREARARSLKADLAREPIFQGQSQTSSSVLKKEDDTRNAVIGKI